MKLPDLNEDPHQRYSRCFGETVGARRRALGISQGELAARSGLSRTAVGLVESGQRSPSAATQSRLAWGLGVTVAELIAETERRFHRGC